MIQQDTKIPFNRKFQACLVVQLITDYNFFRNIGEDLLPEHLESNAHIKLLKIIKSIYKGLKRPITLDIVKNNLLALEQNGAFSEAEMNGIYDVVHEGITCSPVENAVVKRDAFEFLRKQTIARAVSDSIGHLASGHLDTVYQTITDAYKKQYGIGEDTGYKWNTESIADRYKESPRSGVWSTGYQKLDTYLDGGFAESECVSIVSSTGRGKTAMLCNLSSSAIKQGRHVLFASLEMSRMQISQRHDSILAGFSNSEIALNRDYQFILEEQISRIKGRLVVKAFQRGQLSMPAFRNYLDRYCHEVGKPDVIIADWLGCFKMPTSKDLRQDEVIAELADDFVNLTRDYTCCGITAHQSNRSGAGQDTFGYGSVSASFASLFGLDIVLGLGASDVAKDAGKRTLNILKNRVGPDSVFVKLQGDLPGQPLTYKFREAVDDEEAEELLK